MTNTAQLGEAQVPIRATLDKLNGDLSKARGMVEGAIGNLQVVGAAALGGIAAIGATLGAAAIGIGVALAKITVDAAPVEGLSQAFDGLAESAGVGAAEMLAALQKGSSGMVAQRDLMQSFNKAAQLVSTDFAVQLPDAMQYLSKVSAATGTDMGFLVDSLVTGVGRLSPMILDNLGIQVALSEATAKAAEMFGVEEGELTKTQIQAGMMNVTLEKLATNTANMPDVTETASAKMAQFKASIQDAKDQIGMAFMPVLKIVMNTLSGLAERVMPVVLRVVEAIAPVVEKVAGALGDFILSIADGESPLDAFKTLIGDLFPPGMAETITGIIDKVVEFLAKAWEAVKPIVDWITENVKLQDVLIALGIAIATVIIPAIWGLIGAVAEVVAPVIATFLAVLAVVALLRAAWESDFLGIRTALTDAWENGIQPALEALWAWLSVNIPAAIAAVSEWWNGVMLPALQVVWAFIQTSVIPVFETMAETIGVVVGEAVAFLSELWQTVLLPALTTVHEFLSANVFPLFQAFAEFLSAVFNVVLTAMAGLWQNVLAPAIEAVYGWIADKIGPALETLLPIIQTASEWIGGKLAPAFSAVGDAIGTVIDWLGGLTDKIQNIKLPDWLTPGSPTPFEKGLLGIGDALKGLNTMHLPRFQMGLNVSETALLGFTGGETTSGPTSSEQLAAVMNQLPMMLRVAMREAMATVEVR